MSQKRKRAEEEDAPDDNSTIYRSQRISDRDSTFLGLFSPTLKPTDLQSLPEIRSASHKILAWRNPSNQQSITGPPAYTTSSTDDGEKYAGKKVEKVLNSMQVEGACVVARWYGGTLLGPVRFEHIERCAREAVGVWVEGRAKRVRVEEEGRERERLVRVLGERDGSIEVLRRLAAEKEGVVRRVREGGGDAEGGVPADESGKNTQGIGLKPTADYSALPLDRLRTLEKGRDATLAFLLKRIDKAEAELKDLEGDGDKG